MGNCNIVFVMIQIGYEYMLPIQIENLTENDIAGLAELDRHGLLLGPNENLVEYKKRLGRLNKVLHDIEKEISQKDEIKFFNVLALRRENHISAEIMEEAAEYTRTFYDFNIDWVPGFFLSKSLGMLWGGCAIFLTDNPLPIFLIRANFAKNKRWLFYRRDELLAHELCHIARIPIGDKSFEELFAYRLSPSCLRRYAGNCFQNQDDAILFILPIFLLLFIQILKTFFSLHWLPVYPFWMLTILYPLFLLIRNQSARNRFFRAKQNLEELPVKNTLAVLFRCTRNEIIEISHLKNRSSELSDWIKRHVDSELRWKVIQHRFIEKV